MDYLLVCSAALVASGLTLFSGFGLGTLLMPVFAVFFPVDAAVAMTAVVHLSNNVFKLVLLGKHASVPVVLRFGLPAIAAAFGGAGLLMWLSRLPTLATYQFSGVACEVTAAKLIVAALMFCFALWEVLPVFRRVSFGPRALPVGGLLSGFFGGVSGHQGALRSAFLLKCGLTKESFIATGVAIACLVDVARLVVYSGRFTALDLNESGGLLLAATAAALAGALIGTRLVHKVTIGMIRGLVSAMLFGLAGLMAAGVI